MISAGIIKFRTAWREVNSSSINHIRHVSDVGTCSLIFTEARTQDHRTHTMNGRHNTSDGGSFHWWLHVAQPGGVSHATTATREGLRMNTCRRRNDQGNRIFFICLREQRPVNSVQLFLISASSNSNRHQTLAGCSSHSVLCNAMQREAKPIKIEDEHIAVGSLVPDTQTPGQYFVSGMWATTLPSYCFPLPSHLKLAWPTIFSTDSTGHGHTKGKKKEERKRRQELLQCTVVMMKASPGLHDGWCAAPGRKAFGLLYLSRLAGFEGAVSHRQSRLRISIPQHTLVPNHHRRGGGAVVTLTSSRTRG